MRDLNNLRRILTLGLAGCAVLAPFEAAGRAVSHAVPREVSRLVQDCPDNRPVQGWPPAASVVHEAAPGGSNLYVILCETAGDDVYYAVVSMTGKTARRERFPAFEEGRMIPDLVDPDAGRSRELGQLKWDAKRNRLTGELSAGCGGRTVYDYRWTAAGFVLTRQTSSRGCLHPAFKTEYRER